MTAIEDRASRVFISYSHDSPEHEARVRTLADRLRTEGLDCTIDQYITTPAEGWQRWMMNQVEQSAFVLIVATETYNRRFRGLEAPNKGYGAQWEGGIITQELYDANGKNLKFVPVVFSMADTTHIPLPLRSATWYNALDPAGYDNLYYYLTRQAPYVPPTGPLRKRPPQHPTLSPPLSPAPGDDAGDAVTTVHGTAANWTPAQLREPITRGLTRSEIGALWLDLLGSNMEEELPGRSPSDCVIELLVRANRRNLMPQLVAIIGRSYPHVSLAR